MTDLEKNRASILWIDDEIELLKPHIFYLKEKGYKVFTNTNGIDAIKSIHKRNFDLILLDQVMPGVILISSFCYMFCRWFNRFN